MESVDLDAHWSYSTTSAGGYTWEHRLESISEIEVSVPPGGGLASVATVTITLFESSTGKSLRGIWDALGRIEGADLTVALLPQGESYANRIILFSGYIDHASWRAGKDAGEGIGTLIAVDDTLHRDVQLPETVLTPDFLPNLPEQWRGAILPLIYGTSDVLGYAPILMLDTLALVYRAADHPMSAMSTTHAVAVSQGTRFLPLADDATLDLTAATMTLVRPVTENRYSVGTPVETLTHQVSVTGPTNLLDDNPATLALIGTTSLNGDGEGLGRLAVKYVWLDPDGANTAQITLLEHRRAPAGATTTTAELIVRSIDPVSGTVQRDNLFRDGPYRHSSNPRTRQVTVAPLAIVPPAALEVEIEVLHEGGVGGANEVWQVGELHLDLFYQADSLFTPIYLADTWAGRPDIDGMVTGIPGLPIVHAPDVLNSILTQRLGLLIDAASFAFVQSTLTTYNGNPYRLDFGLGSGGWYRAQMAASEILDTLAFQASCYLFPFGDGTIAITEAGANATSQLSLSVSNMANVEIELSRLELVHSTFEVRYGWSVTLGRFTKLATATPSGCNHHDGGTASDLLGRCGDSLTRYGPLPPLIVEGYGIQDPEVADTLLERLVTYHWTQQVLVHCDTTFQAIHLLVGDFVDITHPELPAGAQGGVFEVTRITDVPEAATGRPWPRRLTCWLGTVPSFDYFAIKDQSGVIWYWWIGPAGDLAYALTPPAVGTRIAQALSLGTIPYWLKLGGSGSGGAAASTFVGFHPLMFWLSIPTEIIPDPGGGPIRWVLPSTLTGAPRVVLAEPSVGTGYNGSPILRGSSTGVWYFDISEAEELQILLV